MEQVAMTALPGARDSEPCPPNANDETKIASTSTASPVPGLPFPVLQKLQKPSAARQRHAGAAVWIKSMSTPWNRFGRFVGRKLSVSSFSRTSYGGDDLGDVLSSRMSDDDDETCGEVDEVVVDRSWADELESDASSILDEAGSQHSTATSASWLHLPTPRGGFWARNRYLMLLRFKIWHPLWEFLSPRFEDDETEAQYQKEVWAQSKGLAIWSSLFFIINWILGTIFIPKPIVLGDKIFYYAV